MVKSNIFIRFRNKIKHRIINKLLKKKSINHNRKDKNETKQEVKATKDSLTSLKNENPQQISSNGELEQQESIKEHYFTFQLYNDLFTLLYSTLVFKWIQTDRV